MSQRALNALLLVITTLSDRKLQNAQPAVLASCDSSPFQTWSFVKGDTVNGYIQNGAGKVPPEFKPFCLSLDDCQPTLTVLYDCSPSSDCSNNSYSHFRWSLKGSKIVSAFDTSLCLTVSTGKPYPYASATTGPCAGATEWEFAASTGALRDRQSGKCLTTDTEDQCVADFAANCLAAASPSDCAVCIDKVGSTGGAALNSTGAAVVFAHAGAMSSGTGTGSSNECNPLKHCNVCKGCCSPLILDGLECDTCVDYKCKPTPVPPTPLRPTPPQPTPPAPTPAPAKPTPPASGNECNPTKACNVCKACCQPYIHDGADCDACVKTACKPSRNECNPAKHCNVCLACCEPYIHDGADCDACVQKSCSGPAPSPPPPSPAPPPTPPKPRPGAGTCTPKEAALLRTTCRQAPFRPAAASCYAALARLCGAALWSDYGCAECVLLHTAQLVGQRCTMAEVTALEDLLCKQIAPPAPKPPTPPPTPPAPPAPTPTPTPAKPTPKPAPPGPAPGPGGSCEQLSGFGLDTPAFKSYSGGFPASACCSL